MHRVYSMYRPAPVCSWLTRGQWDSSALIKDILHSVLCIGSCSRCFEPTVNVEKQQSGIIDINVERRASLCIQTACWSSLRFPVLDVDLNKTRGSFQMGSTICSCRVCVHLVCTSMRIALSHLNCCQHLTNGLPELQSWRWSRPEGGWDLCLLLSTHRGWPAAGAENRTPTVHSHTHAI